MKNVFDFFSCKSWMILRKKSFDTFTNKLSLRRLEKDTTWEEALEIGEYTSNLCNTFFISQVNDYIIIENINLGRRGFLGPHRPPRPISEPGTRKSARASTGPSPPRTASPARAAQDRKSHV